MTANICQYSIFTVPRQDPAYQISMRTLCIQCIQQPMFRAYTKKSHQRTAIVVVLWVIIIIIIKRQFIRRSNTASHDKS